MRSANAAAGVAWAAGSAALSALYVLPWKLAAQSGDASVVTLVMLTCAAIFSTAALPWARRVPGYVPGRALGRPELLLGAQLALLTLGGNWSSAVAIAQLSPSLHSVLLRSEVLAVALLALAVLGERVERRFWIGAGIAAAGLLVVHGPGSAQLQSGWGLLAALGAAGAFGTMTVMVRRVIGDIDPVRVNMLRLWCAVALWFAINGAPPARAQLSPRLLLYAALAALSGPFASRLCLMYSTRYVDARVTAMIGLSSPALTLALAWFALGDWPAPRALLGGAIMLLGIAVPISGWLRPGALRARPAGC